MSDFETYQQLNSRRSSVLELGGSDLGSKPSASHFGLTPLGLPGEGYPLNASGLPLQLICQLNLSDAPFVPGVLENLKVLTFFVDAPERFRDPASDRASWCVRGYTTLEGLVPLEAVMHDQDERWLFDDGSIGHWLEVTDHPCHDDPDLQAVAGVEHSYTRSPNQHRTKLGGYPSSIQHEVYWGDFEMNADGVLGNALHGKVVFALQIDSEAKVGLNWGDSGTVYIGRGVSADTAGQWFVSWQFY